MVIVDEFTGRLMPGRRWSDGLHQAVEAKEKVKIERENQTLATITFQNYFRMYKKLAGMTGTAETEAPEFDKIYKLEVLAIPTNRPMIRVENPDVVYRTEREKFEAVVGGDQGAQQAVAGPCWWAPSPSRSRSTSRPCSRRRGIKHVVLNAKYHEREAEIVAQAGRFGAVTIATNMAGRGTDIILGGVPDHRMKAILVEKEIDSEQGHPRGAGRGDRPGHAGDGGRLQEGPGRAQAEPPRSGATLAKRYLGLLAVVRPRPSLGAGGQRPRRPGHRRSRAYLDAAAGPAPLAPRRRSRRPSTRRSRTRWTSWPSTP